ncbi:hypothetical protein CLCR_05213 [Cladophialophora carrionii]|uniref:Uncharacterized protein n=1 Tax=Cladophialophora carrionii TaxID=86049 RepID=A0A1C1CK94_9EURO|nr:hypothetical protein CLCR_05213 [Cladophialophora carrionii]
MVPYARDNRVFRVLPPSQNVESNGPYHGAGTVFSSWTSPKRAAARGRDGPYHGSRWSRRSDGTFSRVMLRVEERGSEGSEGSANTVLFMNGRRLEAQTDAGRTRSGSPRDTFAPMVFYSFFREIAPERIESSGAARLCNRPASFLLYLDVPERPLCCWPDPISPK